MTQTWSPALVMVKRAVLPPLLVERFKVELGATAVTAAEVLRFGVRVKTARPHAKVFNRLVFMRPHCTRQP